MHTQTEKPKILIKYRSTLTHSLHKVTLSKDLTALLLPPTDKLCHYLCSILHFKCQHSQTTIYVSLLPNKPLSPSNGQGAESNCVQQKTCIYWKPSEVAQGELFLPGINRGCDRSTLTKWGAVSSASPITTNSKVLQTCGTARQSLDLSWEKDRKAAVVICNLPLRILARSLSLCVKSLLVPNTNFMIQMSLI